MGGSASKTHVSKPLTSFSPSTVQVVPLSHGKLSDIAPAYPAAKFLALQAYCRVVTPWRMLWTCITLPLPALLLAILPAVLPLKHPREGVTYGYILHSVCITSSSIVGVALHYTAPTGLAQAGFLRRMLAVAVLTVALMVTQFELALRYWTSPIPFGLIVFSGVGVFDMGIALFLVLGRSLWKVPIFKRSLKIYAPSMMIQIIQIIIYPAISVLYDKANNTERILLTIFFPVVKYALKRVLKRAGRHLGEYQTEVAVSGVEICGSLYQSMIMQAVPSKAAMAIIMGLDVVQGVLAIKFFADRHVNPPVRRQDIFDEAERLLTLTSVVSDSSTLSRRQSNKQLREHNRIVTNALQLANAAESILLIEYYEVIIPVVNALFLLVAAQSPSAQYNSRIAPFYRNRDQLTSAMLSITLYSALQGLSCVAMHLVMKHRYGISAIAHLSFVLERYHQSILGKMLAWLPIILHFTLMHYGE
ncbi:hypothetical protein Poli38472_007870 [Pythium oligandrum]|uniref:Uncharacterized protein n=1 Tax=Pythium oligandrum TaxID=41045 RepID=A0A8K1CTW3_PYTOL|nr:hypothetical protein Poli38472_007870 [Pythium oligandrum]|eukprot:TMW68198.1 hypothetical protein Poli38472_007870 [Pythium oligandrum]